MGSNTKKTSAGKGRGGEVGAPTVYKYKGTAGKRRGMTPPKAGSDNGHKY